MCTVATWDRKAPSMRDDLFEKLAVEIGGNREHVERVSLFRDGEPLLDRKLPDRIRRLKAAGVANVGISTNCSLLDEARSSAILEAGLDEIFLSMDGFSKGTFESIRVGLSYEQAMENCLRFIPLRDRIRPSTRIVVRMIVQPANEHEWGAYRAFWAARIGSNDCVSRKPLHNWGGQIDAGNGPMACRDPGANRWPCKSLWSLFVVFANGDVPLCAVDSHRQVPVGEVRTSSIREVWQGRVLESLRRRHLGGRREGLTLCDGCNVWKDYRFAG